MTENRPAPNHLTPMVTDQGFQHLPPIPHSYGGEVRVNESLAKKPRHYRRGGIDA